MIINNNITCKSLLKISKCKFESALLALQVIEPFNRRNFSEFFLSLKLQVPVTGLGNNLNRGWYLDLIFSIYL